MTPKRSRELRRQRAQLCALAGQRQITALPVVLTATISWIATAASWQVVLGRGASQSDFNSMKQSENNNNDNVGTHSWHRRCWY